MPPWRQATDALYYTGADPLAELPSHPPFKSIFYMLPADAAEQAAQSSAASALGLASAHVPVEAPAGLSAATAAACLAALASLPQPCLLTCATGNRASALAAVAQGRARGWGGAATLAWAASQALPFLGVQGLRNWVVAATEQQQLRSTAAAAAVALAAPPTSPLLLRQLLGAGSAGLTYLLGDCASGEAVLIDPQAVHAARDLSLVHELGLRLTAALHTRPCSDQAAVAAALRLPAGSSSSSSSRQQHGQRLPLGSHTLTVLAPAHPTGHQALLLDAGMAFTGELLLVRGCGLAGLCAAAAAELYALIQQHLLTLPEGTLLYPARAAPGSALHSTVGEEARYNPVLGCGRSEEHFTAAVTLAGKVGES